MLACRLFMPYLPCSPWAGDSAVAAAAGCEVVGATTPRGGKSGGGSGLASEVASSLSAKGNEYKMLCD